jgi:predicted naringenin-chalcone synthase
MARKNLSVVQDDPEANEKAVAVAAAQEAPITSRAHAVRNRQSMELNGLLRERESFEDRIELLSKQYRAALNGLNAHVSDIDAAIALITGGIGTPSPQIEQRAEAEQAV